MPYIRTTIKATVRFRLIAISFCCLLSDTAAAEQVLVKVGTGRVTERQLEQAMQSAPFATQFPAMDEADQAYLRGDMLMRLARAEALYQEARDQGFEQKPQFKQEMEHFRTGLLAQRYSNNLHDEISIPTAVSDALQKDLHGNSDAQSAAHAAYIAKRFQALKRQRFEQLKQRYAVKTHYDAIQKPYRSDAIVAEGTGILIKYGDVTAPGQHEAMNAAELKSKTEQRLETLVFARAALDRNESVANQLDDYRRHLLIQMLLEEQQRHWIPDRQTLLDYFQRHPDLGYIPVQRRIGQIVVADRKQAEQLRKRIRAGESLFKLAAKYSIDPYGRQHAGDMGWLRQGSGVAAIEQALQDLPDGEVSEIVETAKGFHLIIITARKAPERKDFAAVEDRVKRALLSEKMDTYMTELMARHPLQWQIADHPAATAAPAR